MHYKRKNDKFDFSKLKPRPLKGIVRKIKSKTQNGREYS